MEKLKFHKWNDVHRNEVSGVLLSRGNKHLDISFQGNLDLYFSLYNDKDKEKSFIIGKDFYEVYEAFDNLYNEVMSGKVVGMDKMQNALNKGLIEDRKIVWRSDDFQIDVAPFFEIEKLDNAYLIKFDKPTPKRKLDPLEDFLLMDAKTTVRICNSGSHYAPYNVLFMKLFNELKEIDPECHQVHMEEYLIDKQIEDGKSLKKILYSHKKSA